MGSFSGIRICFLADKHDLHDDRIYWKMAVPLKEEGAEVHYYLIGDREESGTSEEGISYRIWKLRKYSSNSYLNFAFKHLNPASNYQKMLLAAKSLEADIYHFHDLWLNRIGPALKGLPHSPVVFYDAREPYTDDYLSMKSSNLISSSFLRIFARWVDFWEKHRSKHYDMVIANEENVRDRFRKVLGKKKAEVIFNFYQSRYTDQAKVDEATFANKPFDLIYSGMLTDDRGAFAILRATERLVKIHPKLKVLLLGRIDPPGLKIRMVDFIKENQLENTILFKSQVPYTEVWRYYSQSKIGLILWQPVQNLRIKMPIKLFEYMAFGLPIIGSDLGHISSCIKKENCGILVDPEDPVQIAESLDFLLTHKEAYRQMSENGSSASKNRYVWKKEFDRLVDLYKRALDGR